MVLSEIFKKYLKHKEEEEKKHKEETITVNEAAGVIAFYFEKIRNIVDYQDEHLLRQNAIRRILNRRFLLQQASKDVAEGLVKELVRSRYFANNTLPSKAIQDVALILKRYVDVILSLKKRRICSDKDRDWLLWMAACMIDEHLSTLRAEEALVALMSDVMDPVSVIEYPGLTPQMRGVQLQIAAYRILLRPDINRLRFFLLKKCAPQWVGLDHSDAEELAREYVSLRKNIDQIIHHPIGRKLLVSFRRFRIPFAVLHTIIRNNGHELLEKKELFEREVRRICEGMVMVQRRRLVTRTIRAFIYIFLTKMLLGIAVELPYDLMVLHHINKIPLLVNIIFPPFLIASITLTVRYPNEKNTDAVWHAICEIVYPDTPKEIFGEQRYAPDRKRYLLMTIFTILYLVLFGISFGFIGWILYKLGFTIVSGTLFFIFFCLITFFGITLRRSVRDLVVLKVKPTFFMMFIDSFFLPIMQVGRWLSFNISRINIFVFIFDILIEVPLQALIEITEEWFTFIKEKKEQLE